MTDELIKKLSADVPCGSCNLCCHGDAIVLLPADNPDLYQTVEHPYHTGKLMLAHKENDDCIYLDHLTGCTIHDHKPIICKTFDCRRLYKMIPYNQIDELDKTGCLDKNIWHRGKELLLKQKKKRRKKRKQK